MLIRFKFITFIVIIFTQPLYAASIDDYLKACNKSYGKQFGPEFCNCMADKSKDLSSEEFDFHYAYIAKNKELVDESKAKLEINQRNEVIKLNVLGPSQCNAEIAEKNKSIEAAESEASEIY